MEALYTNKRYVDNYSPAGKDFLSKPSFDVNIELFRNSKDYKRLIISICDYMSKVVLTSDNNCSEDVCLPASVLGIPFNILVIRDIKDVDNWKLLKNTKETVCMLNPRITSAKDGVFYVTSKCVSDRTSGLNTYKRAKIISLSYCNLNGDSRYAWDIGEDQYGVFIQHALDHINGVK